MDAPPVQYVKTSDGCNIAYTVSGQGPPFVLLPFLWTHVQLAWSDPQRGPLLRRLAKDFSLVHFDGRGQGLSQRGLPSTYSMEDRVSEAYAVMSKLKLERAVVAGDASGSHVAIRFAHQYPDRVSALVLLRGTLSLSERWNNFASLAARDWELFLGLAGRDSGLEERAKVEHMQASMTREDLLRHAETIATSDVSKLLTQLGTPTLILHVRDQVERWHSEQAAAKMASLLPNARLAMVGGRHVWGDPDAAIAAIRAFLADLPAQSSLPAPGSGPAEGLSERELEVLRLVAAGQTNQQIADALVISRNTVRRHVSNVFDKTGIVNRAQAGVYAREHGIA